MRSMRADSTMSGLADDDDQSRGHPADMVATAERHGPDQQDTAERQNDDLENGEAANILERVESINKTRGAVAVTEEQRGTGPAAQRRYK